MGNVKLFELKYVPKTVVDYSKYSDKGLMYLCRKYGTQTILWRQQFIGLLPEVNRRKLYEKRGFSSIVEFGKRVAGLSEAQIGLAINLEKKFEDKPVLHEALVKGEISINKLVRVASIVTVENESELAKCAKVLSNRSLEVLVRDVKREEEGKSYNIENENGLFEPLNKCKSLHVHVEPSFRLNSEVIEKLNALHEKGIDVNETILKMLEKREEEIVEKKEGIVVEVAKKEEKRQEEDKEPSRYISVKTKRILKEEFGTKCCVKDCKREAAQLHHTVPFAIGGSNAPDLLKPLCRAHHDILHSVNANYLKMKLR